MMGHYTTRATCNSSFPGNTIKGFALRFCVLFGDISLVSRSGEYATVGWSFPIAELYLEND